LFVDGVLVAVERVERGHLDLSTEASPRAWNQSA
jgi:hypothetical protein